MLLTTYFLYLITVNMNLVSPEIEKYIEAHTTGESDVLQQLNRKTQTDVLMPQMLSGKVQGQFLKFISQMLQPERVLEIGTFTGYAAICLAEGLTENGKLFTIDINEELEAIVKTHVEKAGLQNKIIQIIGNAAQESTHRWHHFSRQCTMERKNYQ